MRLSLTPKPCSPNAATSWRSTLRSTLHLKSSAPAQLACATTASTCRAMEPTIHFPADYGKGALRLCALSEEFASFIAPGPPRRRWPARHAVPVRSIPRLYHYPGPRLPRPSVQRPQSHRRDERVKIGRLAEYAIVCGETLARGHARSGDPAVIAGYIGISTRFDEAIAKFATAYAEQTEHDWQAFISKRPKK